MNPEVQLHRYLIASGILFTFIAATWLVRWAMAVTIVVGGIGLPMWISAFPAALAGSLAVWAFLLAAGPQAPRAKP